MALEAFTVDGCSCYGCRRYERGYSLGMAEGSRLAVAAERAKRDGLLAALKDAREELRLLREKDDCGPYDPTLKGRIDAAIAAAEAAP